MGQFVVVNPLSVSDNYIDENKISIYPNPVAQSKSVHINSDAHIQQLAVRNLNGQLIFHSDHDAEQAHFTINERFESGVYMISLYINNRWEHRKLMVR